MQQDDRMLISFILNNDGALCSQIDFEEKRRTTSFPRGESLAMDPHAFHHSTFPNGTASSPNRQLTHAPSRKRNYYFVGENDPPQAKISNLRNFKFHNHNSLFFSNDIDPQQTTEQSTAKKISSPRCKEKESNKAAHHSTVPTTTASPLRKRQKLAADQRELLEDFFKVNTYPSICQKAELSVSLQIELSRVDSW